MHIFWLERSTPRVTEQVERELRGARTKLIAGDVSEVKCHETSLLLLRCCASRREFL